MNEPLFDLDLLSSDQAQKYKEIEDFRVMTDSFLEITKTIKHQHARSKLLNYKQRPKSVLVTGPSGAGKSAIVEYYRDHFPKQEDSNEEGEITKVPVLYISLPDDKNVKAAPRAILEVLGSPKRKVSETRNELNRAFYGLAKECGVELIIIDELHNAFKAGSEKEVSKIAFWLKTLINDAKIPLILVGLKNECERLITLEEELETRIHYRFHLEFYNQERLSIFLAIL